MSAASTAGLLVFIGAFALVYWLILRGRRAEARDETGPVAFGLKEFKEPGSGAWMSVYGEQWYAMSDSGGSHYGGPWASAAEALMHTQNSRHFLDEHGLDRSDVDLPIWLPRERSWDDSWGIVNILSSRNLHDFWAKEAPEELEYR